jgi:hypothetical protein
MDQTQFPSRAHLFTVRMWFENVGTGQMEWRGEVHDVASGERRYFREWPALVAILQALLPNQESFGRQGDSPNKPEQKGGHPMSS